MIRVLGSTLAGLVAVALLGQAAPAAAQDFYKDKTIRVIVGSAAGGGYDAVARILARHMPKYIPGSPNIVVVNMPGAGGLTMANHIANVAEKDGTVLGVPNRFSPMTAALGAPQAQFKGTDFNWIGTTASYSENAYLLVIRSALPHKNADDLRKAEKPIFIGESGSDVPAILKEGLQLNLKLVEGYGGSDDLELAFERGEVDGHTSGYDSIQARHPTWFSTNFIRPILQFGRVDRLKTLPDVPTARELAKTPEDRQLIEFAELPLMIARPLFAPPGVPKDRVEILRAAFMKVVNDPVYLEEGRKQTMELTPASGADTQSVVEKLTNAPAGVKERYLKALGGKIPS
jgi:tripartite-type tricarboxylate transporter receptor subunit TctC